MTNSVGVVILAAGDGKRMKSSLPKVLNLLHGKPLIEHLVAAVEESGVCDKPTVVVCADHTKIQDYLGDRARYAIQERQLGTGHAAGSSAAVLQGKVEQVIVIHGDVPFISSNSIRRLAAEQRAHNNTITFLTAVISPDIAWHKTFIDFGRIVRDANGLIIKSIEMKDATAEERAINEINVGGYCFEATWFWKNVARLDNNNAQQEYYLNGLVALAIHEGKLVGTVTVDPKEAIGVNTKEQLEAAAQL